MNITKEYLTGPSAAAVIERHCNLNPFANWLRLHLVKFGHRSALIHIPCNGALTDSNGSVDPGVLVSTMNVAVAMIANAVVPETLRWFIQEFNLRCVAVDRVATLALLAESDDLDWTLPGRKVVNVTICLDRGGAAFEPLYLGEVILEIAEAGVELLKNSQPVSSSV